MFNSYNEIAGNFPTRTFSEIFYNEQNDSVKNFKEMFKNSGIPLKIKEETLSTIFYLLYARYGNSHISSFDENQFKYKVQSLVFMYGPTWEKRVEIQDKIRSLGEKDILKGSEAIYNSAAAPGTPISGLVDNEGKLDFLSGQNTTAYKRNILEAYEALSSLLETDVTKEFIDRFANLFIKITKPYAPLWFENKILEEK